MQIITFDNVERQKGGIGRAFTERELEVNMHSNYISERFNYVATQERNRQKNGRKQGESKQRGNTWNKDAVMDRERNFWMKPQVLHRSHVQTASFHQLSSRIKPPVNGPCERGES